MTFGRPDSEDTNENYNNKLFKYCFAQKRNLIFNLS
jgi:hypothetical protein